MCVIILFGEIILVLDHIWSCAQFVISTISYKGIH